MRLEMDVTLSLTELGLMQCMSNYIPVERQANDTDREAISSILQTNINRDPVYTRYIYRCRSQILKNDYRSERFTQRCQTQNWP